MHIQYAVISKQKQRLLLYSSSGKWYVVSNTKECQ
jgi:hypothetical protein